MIKKLATFLFVVLICQCNEDFFLDINEQNTIIQPCFIGGEIFDRGLLVPTRNLILTMPVNIFFEHPYENVIFYGLAKQYYFPNISQKFAYVFYRGPFDFPKKFTPSFREECDSHDFYYYSRSALNNGWVCSVDTCVIS